MTDSSSTKDIIKKSTGKVFLIDGSALAYRAYFAFIANPLTRSDGMNTSAVYGFINTVMSLMDKENPDHMAVIFDSPKPTFRKKLYSEYKATRDKMPEDLGAQLPFIEEFVKTMNIPFIKEEGVEADDVIGTLSRKLSGPDNHCFLVTGDKDFKQMLSENVTMLIPGNKSAWQHYTVETLMEDIGLTPVEFIDYLGLMGDTADNIPGVKGVGKKTAEKLIKEYGTTENLYENLESVKGKLKEKLADAHEMAILSKELVTIKDDLDLNVSIDDMCLKNIDAKAFIALLDKMEFKALSKKFAKRFTKQGLISAQELSEAEQQGFSFGKKPETIEKSVYTDPESESENRGPKSHTDLDQKKPIKPNLQAIPAIPIIKTVNHNYILLDKADIPYFISLALQAKEIAFDLETTSLNPRDAEIIGLSFAFNMKNILDKPQDLNLAKPNENNTPIDKMNFDSPLSFFIPCTKKSIESSSSDDSQMGLFAEKPVEKTVTDMNILEELQPFFKSSIPKGGQNIKFDLAMLRLKGYEVENVTFDTMIESYIVNPTLRGHGIDFISAKYIGYLKIPTSDLLKNKKDCMLNADPVLLFKYACEDAEITLLMHEYFTPIIIKRNLESLYLDVEMPMMRVLLNMELKGFYIDRQFLENFKTELASALLKLEEQIYELTGETFNINSTQQLGPILFEKMKIHEIEGRKKKKIKKTKTGRISTDSKVLEDFSDVPIVKAILEYRTLNKLLSTYVSALPELIDPVTRRIHSTFNQTVTATGRLSSSNPNLQNIPIRTELGKKIRHAFKGDKDNIIVAADYSQIELRVLAHLCNDQDLIEAFKQGTDIHTYTASRIFKTPIEEVTSQMRSRAKTVNFGVLYGMGPQRLAKENDIKITEAKQFIADYFDAYPTIKEYSDNCCEIARETGYASTIMGRQRPVPEINSRNKGLQINGEHIALNTPVQGSAADIIKLAMIALDKRLVKELPQAMMICQIHDELVFEVSPDNADKLIEIIRDSMENVLKLKVPLKVDIGRGETWFQAH